MTALAGYVSVIRQHLGNGQKFAWVELDNELAGNSAEYRWLTLFAAMTWEIRAAVQSKAADQDVFIWPTIAPAWPMSCGRLKRPQHNSTAMASSAGWRLENKMFLNDKELTDLTKRKRAKAQQRQLNAMGIQYKVRADGTLVVLYAHVERIFGEMNRILVHDALVSRTGRH
jgi:hypothetical protein